MAIMTDEFRSPARIASDEAQLEAASEAATLESFAAIDRLEDEGGALAAAPANGSGRLPR